MCIVIAPPYLSTHMQNACLREGRCEPDLVGDCLMAIVVDSEEYTGSGA